MSIIEDILARQILDSRGNPTVEVEVFLEDGSSGRAAVPSGASTGAHEALELRDKDESEFGGAGVTKAVDNVNDIIAEQLIGESCLDQAAIDEVMLSLDDTPNKGKLGANAILGSLSGLRARRRQLPGHSPVPLSGRRQRSHAARPDAQHPERRQARRELHRPPGVHGNASGTGELLRRAQVRRRGLPWTEEGAQEAGPEHQRRETKEDSHPSLGSNSEAIEVILEAINSAGYKAGDQVYIAIDPAASELYEDGKYQLAREGRTLTSDQMVEFYADWVRQYPIISIEDGLAEDDWEGWRALTRELGDRVQIVGDDLFVTNTDRLQQGYRGAECQLNSHQAEPDRHPDRDAAGDSDGPQIRVHRGHFPPVRGDRGQHHRGPGGGDECGTDQDRSPGARGADCQVQPTAPYRGGVGRRRGVRRLERFQQIKRG